MKQYYILSLKHTGRTDAFFTFFRTDSKGYCYYQDWCGLYTAQQVQEKPDYFNDGIHQLALEKEDVDNLMVKVLYDGERMILPNTAPVRKALGIAFNSLQKGLVSSCPRVQRLADFLVLNGR